MSKHLVFYGNSLLNNSALMLELSGWMYWKKRLQFWKWKKHRTMFRPVLVLRGVYEY